MKKAIVLKLRNPDTGRLRLVRDRSGQIVIFPSFKKAREYADERKEARWHAKRIL